MTGAANSRLALRNFEVEDITERYLGWLNSPVLNRYLSQPVWTRTEALAWMIARRRDPNCRFFAICQRRGGTMIGTLKLERQREHGIGCSIELDNCQCHEYRAELALLVGLPGRGYGTEAIRLGTEWAYHEWQVRCVRAGIKTANARSIAAFAKAGFRFEPETVWATCR